MGFPFKRAASASYDVVIGGNESATFVQKDVA